MANARRKAEAMPASTLSLEAKQLQLIKAAQELGIDFSFRHNGVEFRSNDNTEVFNEEVALNSPWWLDESYEPWFFSIRREELEENARMTEAVLKLRNTFGISDRELLNKFVKGGGQF